MIPCRFYYLIYSAYNTCIIERRVDCMLSQLFNTKPLLDPSSRDWILDTFAWAIKEFEAEFFVKNSQLILPTNQFYPGSVSSITEMAQTVFDKTVEYAGMQHWPLVLIAPEQFLSNPAYKQFPKLMVNGAYRAQSSAANIIVSNDYSENVSNNIYLSFNPQQINQPQDLVASFAQTLASILVIQKSTLPPGGKEFLPQAIDVIAIMMGFGVMFANTAYQFKGGCGSCYNKMANRDVALPELEATYCLAVFAKLKDIKPSIITAQLKSHLRSDFKRAYKELNAEFKKSENQHLISFK